MTTTDRDEALAIGTRMAGAMVTMLAHNYAISRAARNARDDDDEDAVRVGEEASKNLARMLAQFDKLDAAPTEARAADVPHMEALCVANDADEITDAQFEQAASLFPALFKFYLYQPFKCNVGGERVTITRQRQEGGAQ